MICSVQRIRTRGGHGVNQEALDNFNKALLGLMQTMVLPEDDGQDN